MRKGLKEIIIFHYKFRPKPLLIRQLSSPDSVGLVYFFHF